MREIHSHKVNECNEAMKIIVLDEPGPGGANHKYALEYPAAEDAAGFRDASDGAWKNACILKFQNGPIKEVGTNGVTHEALLAVICDRLESFQKGPYACRENALALTKLQEAMMWLHKRTRDRLARGVEGTHEK